MFGKNALRIDGRIMPHIEMRGQLRKNREKKSQSSRFWKLEIGSELKARWSPRIISISHLAGLMGIHKLADYCASKFGAVGFAESLMAELHTLGKNGVKSTLVCPYFISTGMFDGEFDACLSLFHFHWHV